MRTPGHDADLAVGFLAGEGLVRVPADVVERVTRRCRAGRPTRTSSSCASPPGVGFDARGSSGTSTRRRAAACAARRRSRPCGAIRGPALPAGPRLAPETIHGLPSALRAAQDAFEQTGGLHAAALFAAAGDLLRVREDVGRHNAVDKLVGSFCSTAGGACRPRACCS